MLRSNQQGHARSISLKNMKIVRLKLKLKGRITSAQDTIVAGGSTIDSALLRSVGRELGDHCRILRELENHAAFCNGLARRSRAVQPAPRNG